MAAVSAHETDALRAAAHPINGAAGDYDALLDLVGDARFVLLLHEVGLPRFFLPLREPGAARDVMMEERLERAIGVLYLPRTERRSHYFMAQLARQFDGVIHIDRTSAVTPLDATSGWHSGEPPETYPHGL